MYQNLQPDMVLLDANVPRMNGFECCREIRKQTSNSLPSTWTDEAMQNISGRFSAYCPILMITALDDVEPVNRAFEAGATDSMTKPVNWAALRQRLHRLIVRQY